MPKNKQQPLKVTWEYAPVPDAEARLKAAFDLIWSKNVEEESKEPRD